MCLAAGAIDTHVGCVEALVRRGDLASGKAEAKNILPAAPRAWKLRDERLGGPLAFADRRKSTCGNRISDITRIKQVSSWRKKENAKQFVFEDFSNSRHAKARRFLSSSKI